MANGADCTTLSIERVRAKITVGSYYYVTTGLDDQSAGDVLSFNINRSRGQPIATLSCQLAVWIDNSGALESFETAENNMGERIIVEAGALPADANDNFDNLPRLFTGYVTNVRESPHWSDARKYILDISAEDEFAKMRYLGRFSRRFKIGDDAFAVITGGKRRQGGNMTLLNRVPAGRRGLEFIHARNSGLENSPLIKTPDTKPDTPQGVKTAGSATDESSTGNYRAEPSKVYAKSGSIVYVDIIDTTTGEAIDVSSLQYTAGNGCLFCMNPAQQYFSGGGGTGAGVRPGADSFPLSWVPGSSTDSNATGVTVTVTGDYPAKLTFIHPQDGGTATIEFDIIPPHSHRNMGDGGPAVAVYDAFGV